jgi:hypothetical protein
LHEPEPQPKNFLGLLLGDQAVLDCDAQEQLLVQRELVERRAGRRLGFLGRGGDRILLFAQ